MIVSRCNEVKKGIEMDPQIIFEMVPGVNDDIKQYPIDHELVDEKDKPSKCCFITERSSRPIWNNHRLLVYRRSEATMTHATVPSRKLRVRLKDFSRLPRNVEAKLDLLTKSDTDTLIDTQIHLPSSD